MAAEGSIILRVVWDGDRIARASVRSSRRLTATRLLEGKPADSVSRLVSMLFSVCGRAQAVAAGAAIDAASGSVPDDTGRQKRELLVAAESTVETMWRVVTDWPQLEDEAQAGAEFSRMRGRIHGLFAHAASRPGWLREPWRAGELPEWQRLIRELERWLEANVFGVGLDEWKRLLEAGALAAWMERRDLRAARLLTRAWRLPRAGASVQFLPPVTAGLLTSRLREAMGDPGFSAMPDWGGEPAETGPLARASQERGFSAFARPEMPAARLLARLVELAWAPDRLSAILRGEMPGGSVTAVEAGDWSGIAAVETSRGTLIHACELAAQPPHPVVSYRIIAPTEWNFHPRGAYVTALTGYPARSRAEAEHIARLMAHALDPCVAYLVELQYA